MTYIANTLWLVKGSRAHDERRFPKESPASSLLVWTNHLRSEMSSGFRTEMPCSAPSVQSQCIEKRASQMCLRRALRVSIKAKSSPSMAPINAPETEASWRDWTPLPAKRKLPQYARPAVQKITRSRFMGAPLDEQLLPYFAPFRADGFSVYPVKIMTFTFAFPTAWQAVSTTVRCAFGSLGFCGTPNVCIPRDVRRHKIKCSKDYVRIRLDSWWIGAC